MEQPSEKAIKKGISRVDKPWGKYTTYAQNQNCTVKIITVEKGEICSLQDHRMRTELWVMIDDGLHVQIDKTTREASAGEEFVIKPGKKHRVSAPYQKGRFLEISFGDFDETDVIRYEDNYGRLT